MFQSIFNEVTNIHGRNVEKVPKSFVQTFTNKFTLTITLKYLKTPKNTIREMTFVQKPIEFSQRFT